MTNIVKYLNRLRHGIGHGPRRQRRLAFESLGARRVLAVTANFFTSIVSDPTNDTIATAEVNVDSAAKLDAWIDFDGNGQFDHPSEHLSQGTSIDVFAGSNRVTIFVPAGAASGLVQARFLTSESGGLLPDDIAGIIDSLDASVTILSSQTQPDVDLNVSGNRINLSAGLGDLDLPELIVSSRTTVLFRAPASAVGRYVITADEFSNVLQLDFAGGDPIPSGGISFDGGARVDTVRVIGGAVDLDLSAGGNLVLENIDVIDISDPSIQRIVIDAPAASAMDRDGGGIVIIGGSEDLVRLDDREQWRMSPPEVVAGLTFNVVSSNDTFVQVDFGSGWQNLASPGDVNNNGEVSAGDALIIINELRRHAYSDIDTSVLQDSSTVDPWPSLYYDQNNDGKVTALDALRVINEIARSQNSPSNEWVAPLRVDAVFYHWPHDDGDDQVWQQEPILT